MLNTIKKHENIIPFFFLAFILIILHLKATPALGDDIYFSALANSPDFSLLNWLHTRYSSWTSRTVIEGCMMIIYQLPFIVWKVLDILSLLCIAVFSSKLFCKKDYILQKNMWITCFMIIIDFTLLHEAGWVATTLNYTWPLTCALIALYPLKKIIEKQSFHIYEYILYSIFLLYAVSSEQMNVLLLIIFGMAIVYLLKNNYMFSSIRYIVIQFLFTVLNIIYFAVCPGNKLRLQEETANWFSYYSEFTFIKKIELGISSTLKTLLLEKNIYLLIFILILSILLWKKYEKWIFRLSALFPALAIIMLQTAYDRWGDTKLPNSLVTPIGTFYHDNLSSAIPVIIYSILLFICCTILINIYLLYENSWKTILLAGIFLLGLMSKAMLGFSPTIWSSGNRTSLFLIYCLIICSIILLNDWNYKDKSSVSILTIAGSLILLHGLFINIANLVI